MRVPTTQGATAPQAQQGPQPSPEALLMAAAQMGLFKMAGDVIPYGKGPAPDTLNALGKAVGPDAKGFEGSDPGAVAKGVMQGKVKVLRPEGK